DAARLKREIGDTVVWIPENETWRAEARDTMAMNRVLKQIYHNIDEAVDRAVPSVARLNDRYANLLSAEKSVKRVIKLYDRQSLVGMPDLVTAGAAYGAAGGPAAVAAGATSAGLRKLGGSTPVRTGSAYLMEQMNPNNTSNWLQPLASGLRSLLLGMR